MADNAQPSDNAQPPQNVDTEMNDDLDASIEADLQPEPTQPDAMNLDGANDAVPARNGVPEAPPLEARISAKKDATLREFLSKMDDHTPIIPDAVTNYYLTRAGLPPPPQTSPHLARLLALATQKFIADIAADAYQYSRIRASNTTSNNPMGGLAGGGGPQGAAMPGGIQGGKDSGSKAKDAALGAPRAGYGGGGQGGNQGRTVLTMEDLGMAVSEYGVNIKRGEFYR